MSEPSSTVPAVPTETQELPEPSILRKGGRLPMSPPRHFTFDVPQRKARPVGAGPIPSSVSVESVTVSPREGFGQRDPPRDPPRDPRRDLLLDPHPSSLVLDIGEEPVNLQLLTRTNECVCCAGTDVRACGVTALGVIIIVITALILSDNSDGQDAWVVTVGIILLFVGGLLTALSLLCFVRCIRVCGATRR